PARRRPGPFEKGLREAVGIDLLALLLLKSSNKSSFPKTIPRPRFARAPLSKGGKRLRRLCAPCGITRRNYSGPRYNVSLLHELKMDFFNGREAVKKDGRGGDFVVE
ncbi:hypothetical protein, partial [Pseudoflavonifractor sp. 60]|uniref:hypothetical protein n=1 Tax=Pseudoflavonifractor sp. 60 TaxID=2304576 RepID=UPI001A9B83A2